MEDRSQQGVGNMRMGLLAVLILVVVASGCRSRSSTDRELALGTTGAADVQLHTLKNGMTLKMPCDTYIIGMEKSKREKILPAGFKDCTSVDVGKLNDALQCTVDVTDIEAIQTRANKVLDDGRRAFLSQIYWAKSGTAVPLFDFYDSEATEGMDLDNDIESVMPYTSGWRFLLADDRSFAKQLKTKIDEVGYSHVFVIAMGWNTNQERSLKNFNELMKHVIDARDRDSQYQGEFKPLVIGVTWHSFWPRTKVGSVRNKANDADELGLTWMNLLVNRVLPADSQKPYKLILIGHSYGARMLARAMHSELLLTDKTRAPHGVDVFIGMQAATSIRRWYPIGSRWDWLPFGVVEGRPFRKSMLPAVSRDRPPRQYLTQSKYDWALKYAFWSTHAGRPTGRFDLDRAGMSSVYSFYVADSTGRMTLRSSATTNLPDVSHLYLIDAEKVVNTWKFPTGAHGDVKDKEMGEIIWYAVSDTHKHNIAQQ